MHAREWVKAYGTASVGVTYVGHKLENNPIPFAGFRILGAIFCVRDQIQDVVETDLPRHAVQQINAKPVKSAIPRIIFSLPHHYVRDFLVGLSNRKKLNHAHSFATFRVGSRPTESIKFKVIIIIII